MDRIKKIYQCEVCGQVIENIHNTKSPLICCGQKMIDQIAQTKDSSVEKHVPFIESKGDNKVLVRIGKNAEHPMTDDHYIQFIEIITKKGIVLRYDLTPQDKPQAEFDVSADDILEVREFCNIHGLWKR